MKRAGDGAAAHATLVGDDARAAMPADIVEGTDRSVAAAHHQGPLARHVEGEVGAGLGEVAFVADQLPGAAEQELLLELEQFGTAIAPAGKPTAVPPGGNRQVARLHVHGAASRLCLSAHSK